MFSRWLRMLKIHWILLRYGLYETLFFIPFFRVFKFTQPIIYLFNGYKKTPLPIRVRLAIEALGPTFIKLGQALSTRRDLLPDDYVDELIKLQDNVPPFSSDIAIAIIEKSLKRSLSDLFLSFEEIPLAAASIAQVHTAHLKNGDKVAVKVVRPNIQKVILRDIGLMAAFASLMEKYLSDGKRLRPIEVVAEYKKTILNELDLTIEAANGAQLKRNFEGSNEMYIPHIYWDYTRRDVMVMEFVTGVPVDHVDELRSLGVNIPLLAERSVEIFFKQVFVDSFFHADMHPGNILVDVNSPKDPTYIALDYGIIGSLNAEDQHYLASNFLAFFNRDYKRVAELHIESGWVPSDTSIVEFETAIRAICEPIFNKPLSEISFGGFLLSLFQVGRRFNMIVQPQLVLLQKTLFSIEGIGRQLYPELDLWKTGKPFLVKFVQERKGAKATAQKYLKNMPIWIDQLPDFIKNVGRISEVLSKQNGQLVLPEELLKQYEKSKRKQSDRVVFAIIGATLFLLGASIWHQVENWIIVVLMIVAIFFFIKSLLKE